MKPNDGLIIQRHIATKEEALERARKAVEVGLVPGFGRLRSDAINRIGGPVPDTGDLFNLCYCCSCCCVVGNIKDAPSYVRSIFKRFEGLTVAVDSELCTNCGACAEVCIFGGMEMEDGELVHQDEKCFGCGRCESVCPTEAISITMDEDSVERMITRIEEHVDVTQLRAWVEKHWYLRRFYTLEQNVENLTERVMKLLQINKSLDISRSYNVLPLPRIKK